MALLGRCSNDFLPAWYSLFRMVKRKQHVSGFILRTVNGANADNLHVVDIYAVDFAPW